MAVSHAQPVSSGPDIEAAASRSSVASKPSFQMNRPPSNARVSLVVEPIFAHSLPLPTPAQAPPGSLGSYRVKFLLCVPGRETYRTTLDLDKIMASGESLLSGPPMKITHEHRGLQHEITLEIGANKTYATAELVLTARDRETAITTAHNIVMPLLSWWSFSFDVALDVAGHEIYELASHTQAWTIGVIGEVKSFDTAKVDIFIPTFADYATLAAAYREGVNSANPFYQVLCFFKVAEGIKALRKRCERARRKAGAKLPPFDEAVPADLAHLPEDQRHALEAFRGASFSKVLDTSKSTIRDAVAHLTTNDGLVADRYQDFIAAQKWASILRYVGRTMVLNQLDRDKAEAAAGARSQTGGER